jgi:hypothetical protein
MDERGGEEWEGLGSRNGNRRGNGDEREGRNGRGWGAMRRNGNRRE